MLSVSPRYLFILAIVALAVMVFLYSASVKEKGQAVVINAESFSEILQDQITQKSLVSALDYNAYEYPLDELVVAQAESFGMGVAVISATWQKVEINVLQGDAGQSVDWLSDLAVIYGVRVQSLHILSDSAQAFSIDKLVLVR